MLLRWETLPRILLRLREVIHVSWITHQGRALQTTSSPICEAAVVMPLGAGHEPSQCPVAHLQKKWRPVQAEPETFQMLRSAYGSGCIDFS
ncbi:hypothetical protein WJX77_000670 [Trebouxia sp. C0004]